MIYTNFFITKKNKKKQLQKHLSEETHPYHKFSTGK